MARKAPVDTMSSGPWSIKPTVVKRLVTCAEKLGFVVKRIEADYKAGKVSLAVVKPDEGAAGETVNEWDTP